MPKKLNTGQPSISFSKSGRSVTVRDGNGRQIRRMLTTISRYASNIYQKAVALSEKLSGTPKFTDELGLNGQYPIIIREEVLNTADIRAGQVGDVPADVLLQDIKKLERLAKDKEAFEDEFYGYVGEYYLGKSDILSTAQIKTGLQNNAFQVPYADVVKAQSGNTVADMDYAALRAWIKDHSRQINVRKIDKIKSQAELRHIIDLMENNIPLDSSLLNKTKRSAKKSVNYFYNRLTPEQKKR